MADELAPAEASKYGAACDQPRQPQPHKVTRTADELAAAEASRYGASSNQRRLGNGTGNPWIFGVSVVYNL